MNKIQVMKLVVESSLNKYEKLFLLDFIYNEPEESIPFILDEFNLKDVGKALKAGYEKGKETAKKGAEAAKEAGKKVKKKASDIYYGAGVKAMHHPVWSRVTQWPAAIADLRPGAIKDYPVPMSDVSKGVSWAKKKLAKAQT